MRLKYADGSRETVCSTCGRSEREVGFYRRNGVPRTDCISCFRQKDFLRRANGRTPEETAAANPCRVKNRSRIVDGVLVRACSVCAIVHPESVYLRTNDRGRLRGICPDCMKRSAAATRATAEGTLRNRERSEAWRRDNRARHKSTAFAVHLRKYGLSVEQYGEMLDRQGGKCAICRRGPEVAIHGRLVVDHCHAADRVRGLLCNACNTGIGQLGDDVERVAAAADYLRRACRE